MLKAMRESFHHLKWILLAVVAAFIVGFVYLDTGLGGPGNTGDDQQATYAARVNGETISYRDYNRALYYTEENYKRMYGGQFTPEMAEAMGLGKMVLDQLVDQRLMLQEARRLNLDATPDEVKKRIRSMPVLNPDGKFVGSELYTRYITGQLGYNNAAEFEEDIAREITMSKIESALSNSLVISPKAAEAEYRRLTENAKIRYVLYPADREAAAVTVSDAEVDAYYREHQADYAHGEQRSLKFLIADTAAIRQQVNPTDQELRARYEAQKESFKTQESARILHILVKVEPGATPEVVAAASAKAQGLVAQLRAGGDFAALARANSQDPSSAGNGGDMGFIERGQTVEAFDTAAFTIPLNTISDPIRTPEYGFHIIKVLERRPSGYRPFEEAREQLRYQVADQMSKDQARDAMNAIATRVRESKPATAEAFAALANDRVKSNDATWFQKNDQIPGIGNNPPLATWVFAAKEGDVSEVIGTQRGPVLAYISGVRPAGVSPLTEVREKVAADAKVARARERARAALTAAIAGSATVDEVGAKVGLPATETTVSRQTNVQGMSGDTTALVDAAMSGNVGQISGPILAGDGAVVFQITEQKKVDQKDIEQNRTTYVDALRQQQARSLRQSLLQRLRKGSKIEVNDQVVAASRNTPPRA